VDHLADAFKKYGFQHRECLDCGFVFVDPHPPADVLAKLYAGAYYTGVREHYELPRLQAGLGGTEFSAPFAALEAAIERCTAGRAAGRWLDVGGGLGSYAALIAERKPGWELLLNEMNPRSVEIAASVLGIKTVTGDPEALLAASERFDVVSSVSVLEHIPDPASFLIGYSRLLKPGGVMVTMVPQFTALNSAVSRGSSANVVPPYHLSLFNRRSLETMLRRTRCFERFEIDQAGESAFSLVHHVDFGDMWDITIPTAEAPVPQGVQLVPYEHATEVALNALARADKEVGPYFFADNDGRTYLIAYGWAPGNR
jgi:SAM-dependent methyltransferase